MHSDPASRIAEHTALIRAIESCRPEELRLFADPLAFTLLTPSQRRLVRLARMSLFRAWLWHRVDRRIPGARTSVLASTAYMDNAWSQARRDGFPQIVLLGSSLDCRALRLPFGSSTVFEVDRPETLAAKREHLAEFLRTAPANIRYAEADLDRCGIEEALARAGFNRSVPSLFLWEGGTGYRTVEAAVSVFSYVGGCAPSTRIGFTYFHSGLLDGSVAFEDRARVLDALENQSESWTFGFDPRQLPALLQSRNLVLDYDHSAEQYRRICFGADAARAKGYCFHHIALAHVP